jgi:hypothetical protein
MPFKEITEITLEAAQAIELDTGVVLPPGSYPGARMRVVSKIFRTLDQATAPVCMTCDWWRGRMFM